MDSNTLKMNDSKTEFIQFGSKQELKKCETESLAVSDYTIKKRDTIKYIGIYLDENLSFKSTSITSVELAWLITIVEQTLESILLDTHVSKLSMD